MSASFAASTADYVNHGSDTSLDDLDPITVMCWIYLNTLVASSSARNLAFNKATAGDEGFSFYPGGASDNQVTSLVRQGSGTWLVKDASNTNFAHFGVNKWLFCAAAAEFGVAGKTLIGDLSNAPTEPSSYDVNNQVGSGSLSTDAGQNFYVGSGRTLTTFFGVNGIIAFGHIVSGYLTDQQIYQQWMMPHVISGSRMFRWYGLDGTMGTQYDWSGYQNNGTVTAATYSDSYPPIHISPGGIALPQHTLYTAPAAGSILPFMMHM